MDGSRRAVGLFVVVVLAVFAPLMASPSALGTTNNKLALVVEHTDGNHETNVQCIPIASTGTTALQALTKSNFAFYTISFGGGASGRFLCWLDGEGQVPGTQCPDSNNNDPYWEAWLQTPGHPPHVAMTGIGSLHVAPKDILYLQYADQIDPGVNFDQNPPTTVGFRSVCPG